ncbi:MAG: hypothetical protein HW416_291 [Chloroflexi bacterium]|nr:hypothetical protein [Chloroflexota bacterium]
MRFAYDEAANAVYVFLAEKPYAYGRDLDSERRIDYAADDTPVGVKLTCVRSGVNMVSLPAATEIAQILRQIEVRVYA